MEDIVVDKFSALLDEAVVVGGAVVVVVVVLVEVEIVEVLSVGRK